MGERHDKDHDNERHNEDHHSVILDEDQDVERHGEDHDSKSSYDDHSRENGDIKSSFDDSDDSRHDDQSRSSYDSYSEDSSLIDDVEAHPELRQLKYSSLGSLWGYENNIGPLICPEMAESMRQVFKRIQ